MIVDGSGRAISPDDSCPKCGSEAKHQEKVDGFGGHSKTICNVCAYVFEETHPPRKEAS